MAAPDNQEYYVARAATSRALAQRSTDPMIADIHRDFASRYELLATVPESASADGQAT